MTCGSFIHIARGPVQLVAIIAILWICPCSQFHWVLCFYICYANMLSMWRFSDVTSIVLSLYIFHIYTWSEVYSKFSPHLLVHVPYTCYAHVKLFNSLTIIYILLSVTMTTETASFGPYTHHNIIMGCWLLHPRMLVPTVWGEHTCSGACDHSNTGNLSMLSKQLGINIQTPWLTIWLVIITVDIDCFCAHSRHLSQQVMLIHCSSCVCFPPCTGKVCHHRLCTYSTWWLGITSPLVNHYQFWRTWSNS